MKVYSRFMNYFKPLTTPLITGVFCLILVTAANLAIPKILQIFIDDILIVGNTSGLTTLNLLVIGFLLLYFVKGLFFYGQTYMLAYVGQKIVLRIREELYRHIQFLSLSFHQRMRVGELISRVSNDVQVVENSVVQGLPGLIAQPLTVVGSVILVFLTHWKLAVFTIAVVPFIALSISKFGARMRKTSTRIQAHMSDFSTILQENLSAIRIVKAFVREEDEIRRFNGVLQENFHAGMKAVQITATMTPVLEIIASIGGVVFFWYGGQEVISGRLTPGELMEFISYMAIMVAPLNSISRDLNLMQRAAGALERIFELMDIDEHIIEQPDAVVMPPIKGYVEFTGVSMGYGEGERDVLQNISLKVEPGQIIALVGASGAGKTTLVNLIPRFYDPTGGIISIDGYDLSNVQLASLRKQIALVPQDTILFQGTIAYNIAYGRPDATMEEIVTAAQRANAHQFIMEFAQGYETMVGERGQSLSGGQKQRIAIARAILADPRILVLDEATSALDSASEQLVKEALVEVMKNRTTFVIAHRLSTVLNADRIVVLEHGKIVEIGNHDELLARGGLYSKLYRTQMDRD